MSVLIKRLQKSENMKIENIQDDETKLSFDFKGSTAEANLLRRSLISNVACIAFDWITIHENSSCMPNELIAHRIGMIPVVGRGHISMMADKEDRTWRNCVKFELEIEGKNAYSNDLCIQDDAKEITVLPDIIIVSMKDSQK